MPSLLPKSPFPVVGRLAKCWLFTFREPAETAAPLLPEPLELIVRDGFAFWNVVVCELEAMRPAGFPAGSGMKCRQVGYRLYARWRPNGMPIDGLHFLRSECDSGAMTLAGNALTDFKFHHAKINFDESEERTRIGVDTKGARVDATIDRQTPPALTAGSPFDSLYEAKAVLAYKPAALAPVDKDRVRVLSITRDETAWTSQIVHTPETHFEYLANRPKITPEICYEVAPITYRWNAARTIRRMRPEA
ncbi:MAG: DUF2071 domain-containing protein [Verrucomicrobiota bacterium]